MRDLFPQFNKPSTKDLKKMWDDGIFVFDTNVLLNLYRLPEGARSNFLDVVKGLGSQVWIPHHVALEFYRKRPEVVHDKSSEIDSQIATLEKVRTELKKHFDSETFITKLDKNFNSIKDNVQKAKLKHCASEKKDEVEDAVNSIFKDKMGTEYSESELQDIYKKGEDRYAKEIPPGYKDRNKDKKDKTGTRKFGDLIIWNQILDKAKLEKKTIIFITDEQYEDWWRKVGGTTIGPRYELIDEMKKEADVMLLMYQSETFIKHAANRLNIILDKELLKLIEEFKTTLKTFDSSEVKYDSSGTLADSLATASPISDLVKPVETTLSEGIAAKEDAIQETIPENDNEIQL